MNCICEEKIIQLEIKTKESGWFTTTLEIKFCPFCGRDLSIKESNMNEPVSLLC